MILICNWRTKPEKKEGGELGGIWDWKFEG